MRTAMYSLPDGMIIDDPALAAEAWAVAFYQAKGVVKRLKLSLDNASDRHPDVALDRTVADAYDCVLHLGER